MTGKSVTMMMRTLKPSIAIAALQTARAPPKTANKFYLSREWLAVRDRVRREARGRCETPGCGRVERRMFVDHIVELKDGGAPLDRANAWLLCGSCHSLKTAAARAMRTVASVGGGSVYGSINSKQPHCPSRGDFFPSANTPSAAPKGAKHPKEG